MHRRSARYLACERGDFDGQKCPRRLQAPADFSDRHWPAEAEAPHRMSAGRAQEELLVGRLHAFRRDLHAETAAEADDRVDDGRGIGGLLDRLHETAVDLELVERKAAQIKQAGI